MQMSKTTLCVFFCFFLLRVPAYSHVFPLHSYTTRDGLISNWVTTVLQDSHGYLWIGTNEGLCMYDGATFTNFTTLDGLSNNFITALLESKRNPGTIWIGTIQRGLTRYSDGRFTKVPVGSTPLTNNVISIVEDAEGTLWVGTSAGAFRVVADTAILFLSEGSFAGGATMAASAGRHIWVANTQTAYVYNVHGQRVASPNLHLGRGVFIDWMNADRDHDVWIGTTENKVLVFRDTTLLFARLLPRRSFGALLDSYGLAWVGIQAGVVRGRKADFGNALLTEYGIEHGFSEPWTSPVLEDREGNLWFQAGYDGLLKLSERGLVRFPMESYTGAAILDRSDHVWALVGNGVCELWRSETERWFSVVHDLPSIDSVEHGSLIAYDALGRLCLISPAGFLRLYDVHRTGSASRVHFLGKFSMGKGILRGPPLRAFVDRKNRLWYSLEGSGILVIDLNAPVRQLARLKAPEDLPLRSVRAMFQDARGDMWLGDYNGGLVVFQGADWTRKPERFFTTADGLPDNGIRSFGEDEQGRLWVGTRFGGAAIFDGKRFTTLSMRDGLISNSIWSITSDHHHRMWLGTGSGLMSVSSETMTAFGGIGDFLGSSVDFCAAGRDGLLWFGKGGAHISAYDMRSHQGNTVPPPVYITHIAVNDSIVSAVRPRDFPFDKNNFMIQFVGISFRDEREIQYQYRLNNSHWSKSAKQRTVSLAALSPGEYIFEVQAINSHGIVSAQPAAFSFAIIPPFWQRLWFELLVACCMLGLLYGLYLYRIRQLLKVERLRTRIATDLHDDIGASLTRIALFSDIAKDEARSAAPRLSEIADRIGKDARELLEAVSTLVWSIDPRHDRLEEVLIYMKEFAQEMFELKGISYRFTADESLTGLRLPVETRRNLLLVFKEAIHNIVRHAECTEARVDIMLSDQEVCLSVADNGKGFAHADGPGGHGLSNMKGRAKAAGGDLTITSSIEAGTRVDLRVPAK
jgi:ligand-binding sensor domain-containing protein/two-component sensor histidine kinase